jgi:site-specific recombinase XerD
VTCHTFRQSSPERGHRIRSIQELLDHRDVRTIIYTDVLCYGARRVCD